MAGMHIRRPVYESVHVPSLIGFLRDWGVVVVALAMTVCWPNLPVAIVAVIIIATRQHAMLVLYHDGVHGLIARPRRLNDFIVNLAIGVPLLLPVHLYRALHQRHHQCLGSVDDPERSLLYRDQAWNYRPLPTLPLLRQMAGDLLAWNAIIMAIHYVRGTRKGGVLMLPRSAWHAELLIQCAGFYGAVVLVWLRWPEAVAHAVLIWFIAYFTLTQMLQKIRSFAEHTTEEREYSLSCSWSPGILGRLTIWPYHINYHREHHARPDVPWSQLPTVFPDVSLRPARTLLSHLWKGIGP